MEWNQLLQAKCLHPNAFHRILRSFECVHASSVRALCGKWWINKRHNRISHDSRFIECIWPPKTKMSKWFRWLCQPTVRCTVLSVHYTHHIQYHQYRYSLLLNTIVARRIHLQTHSSTVFTVSSLRIEPFLIICPKYLAADVFHCSTPHTIAPFDICAPQLRTVRPTITLHSIQLCIIFRFSFFFSSSVSFFFPFFVFIVAFGHWRVHHVPCAPSTGRFATEKTQEKTAWRIKWQQ